MDVRDLLPRDAIPSIDEPAFGGSYFGESDDAVIVVESDPPRAYPVRILSYHEIVNDVVDDWGAGPPDEGDGDPIAVTWCPICASAVVYSRRVDGRVLTFGTSGKLADDALVMYDRETESEWKQPLGRAIAGPLEGTDLEALPASMSTVGAFRTAHPDGVVLQPVREGAGADRAESLRAAYDMAGYDAYDAGEGFGFRAIRGESADRSWSRTDIAAKTRVIGIVVREEAVGYPVPAVREAGGVVTDRVGDIDVLVVATGDEAHAFEDPGHAFSVQDGNLHGDGAVWNPRTGRSNDGRRLARLPARILYAFAWQDDHGPGAFYGLD